MKLKDNSAQEIDTALYQLEQKLKSNIRLTDVENSNASTAKINAVDKKLTEEIKDRQSADEKLQVNINKEIADRKDADAAIENAKQDKLIAGNNIQIDGNIISATPAEYTAEAPVKVTDGKISLDTVPIAKGGTGATTAENGFNTLANGVRDSSKPVDNEKMLLKPTTGTWYKTTCLDFWNYIKGKISSVLGLTKDNYGGKSAKSSFLDFYTGVGGKRPASGNIVPKDASECGGMRKDVVTSSMTDSGRPGQDGHLLTMFWDGNGRWDSQFFVSCEKPLTVKVRVKADGTDYEPWVDIITSNNIGSQTVANADKANTAGNADTVDNYHANQLWRSDGANWNPNADVTMTPSGNNSEWSFDFRNKNGATGSYWHVWDEDKSTLLKVNADDGKVSAPYGFVGNLSGKADTAGTADSAATILDSNNGTPIKVRWGGPAIDSAEWYPAFNADGSVLGPINRSNIHVGTADTSNLTTGVKYTGEGVGCITAAQTPSSYNNSPADWASYIICNHDNGTTYYHQMLRLPFFSDTIQLQRRVNGELKGWKNVAIMENENTWSGRQNFTTAKASSKMVIPIGAPSPLEDGCIWIS